MKKLFAASIVFAAPALALGASKPLFTKFEEVVVKLCKVMDWVYTAAIIVGVISVLIAAFQYITAHGDPEKISKAHKAVLYAAIGIAVAIIAAGVPFIVSSVLGGSESDVSACGSRGSAPSNGSPSNNSEGQGSYEDYPFPVPGGPGQF